MSLGSNIAEGISCQHQPIAFVHLQFCMCLGKGTNGQRDSSGDNSKDVSLAKRLRYYINPELGFAQKHHKVDFADFGDRLLCCIQLKTCDL